MSNKMCIIIMKTQFLVYCKYCFCASFIILHIFIMLNHLNIASWNSRGITVCQVLCMPMMVYLCQKRVFATRCNYLQRVVIQ